MTLSRRFRVLFCAIVVIGLSQCFCQADPIPPLLQTLIKQNEEAISKFRVVEYRVSYNIEQWPTPNEDIANICSGHVFERGDWRASELTCLMKSRDHPDLKQTSRAVLNDQYSASWPDIPNRTAYRFDHQSIAQMSREAKLQDGLGAALLQYASLGGPDSLGHEVKVTSTIAGMSWKVIEPANGRPRQYEIREEYTKPGKHIRPWTIWILDADRGFLVTHTTTCGEDGQMGFVRDIAVELLPDGKTWCPKTMTETSLGSFQGTPNLMDPRPGNTVTLSRKITIKNLQMRDSIPDEQFQLGFLQLNKDNMIIETDVSGHARMLIQENGVFVPSPDENGQ